MRYTVAIFVLFAINVFAQPAHWQRANGPYGMQCFDVFYLPDSSLRCNAYRFGFTKQEGDPLWQPHNTTFGDISGVYYSPNGTIFMRAGYDILRSTDNGATWKSIVKENWFFSVNLATGALFSQGRDSLYRSFDDGETWEPLPFTFSDIRVLGRDFRHRLIADITDFNEPEPFVVSVSTDEGKTWKKDSILSYYHFDEWEPVSDAVCYARMGYQSEVYRTLDSGNTWTRVAKVGTSPWVYTRDIQLCGPNLVIVADNGIHLLDTATNRLSDAHTRLTNAWSLFRSNSGKLYASTTTGVYTSADCGDTWIDESAGIPAGNVSGIIHLSQDRMLVQGSQVFLTSDAGGTWAKLFTDSPAIHSCIPCGSNGSMYTIIEAYNKIMKGDNNAENWKGVYSKGETTLLSCNGNGALYKFDKQTRLFSYTTDGGAAWIEATKYPGLEQPAPNRVAITANGVIHVGVSDSLAVYNPGTGVWNKAEIRIPQVWPPCEIQHMLLSDSGYVIAIVRVSGWDDYYVLHIENSGAGWKSVYRLPSLAKTTYRLMIDARKHLFVLLGNGRVMTSADAGYAWTDLVSPYATQEGFSSIAFDSDGYLWGSTWYEGLFRSSRPLAVEPTPPVAATSSLAVYPNPAVNVNTVTASITLDEINTGALTLEVVNELGAVLHTQQLQSDGRRQITASVPVSVLPTGYYVMRVTGQGRAMQQGVVVFRK